LKRETPGQGRSLSNVSDFYVVKEWPVEKVAQTLGVERPDRFYLAKFRVGRADAKKKSAGWKPAKMQIE